MKRALSILRHPLALMLALFFLAGLPLLRSVYTYLGDERFYTDSAIRMAHTSQYLTPVYPDGAWRFNKPILTYWAIAASHRLFGVSLLTSRLPSLVAGAAVIALGYLLALVLWSSRRAAAWSAWILFSNLDLLYAATRSTPDVFQCLFLSLSLLGFARLLFGGESHPASRRSAFLCAYLGAGLAVAAKGFAGLLPVAFAFAFCAASGAGTCRVRDLIHVPSMLAGLAVAAAWYVAVFALHGSAALRGFLADQTTHVGPPTIGHLLGNLIEYGLGPLRSFLPWTAVLAAGLLLHRRALAEALSRHRGRVLFAVSWYLILVVVFASADIRRFRYLLPALPLLAACGGLLFDALPDDSRSRRLFAVSARTLALAVAALGLILVPAGLRLDGKLAAVGASLLAAAAVAWVSVRRSAVAPPALAASALLTFLALVAVQAFVIPAFESGPAPALAARLRAERADRVLMVGVPSKYAGQVNVLMGGQITVEEIREDELGDAGPPPAPRLFFPARLTNRLDLAGWRVEDCGSSYPKLAVRDLLGVLSAPDPRAALLGLRARYCLAVRAEP